MTALRQQDSKGSGSAAHIKNHGARRYELAEQVCPCPSHNRIEKPVIRLLVEPRRFCIPGLSNRDPHAPDASAGYRQSM